MKKWVVCTRCNGKGEKVGYKHIDNGMCWGCDGAKGFWVDTEQQKKERAEARSRKTEEKAMREYINDYLVNVQGKKPVDDKYFQQVDVKAWYNVCKSFDTREAVTNA